MFSQSVPQLRLSCDECLSSKVKCDRQKPICERCRSHGTVCLYSPSRKTGRPSLAARKRNGRRPSSATHATLAPKSPMDNSQLESPATLNADSPLSVNESCSYPEWNDLIEELDPFHFAQSWDHTGDDEESLRTGPQNSGPSAMAFPYTDHEINGATEIPADDQEKCLFSSTPVPVNHLIYGCDFESQSVLGALHCANQPIKAWDSTITPSTEGGAVPSVGSCQSLFHVDSILQRNRCAVSSLNRLLDCPCARQPYLAMLYVAIVFKVLAGYQVAAYRLSTSKVSASASNVRATSARSTIVEQSHTESRPTRIRIGSFELDDTDQDALFHQLLLIEMCKVDLVVNKLIVISQQISRLEGGITICMGWYHLACLATKTKLQDIKNMINAAVGAAHQ
ncbi:Hypothetical protein R9X50_00711300 [Acrodontium crateriforme]|uniref:Zn(2)-C6 fungal-type domain-containing protein n=1 Tax=Acrodontium crateriforme TaxID=150365 RepID=A0AAQ3MA67_9PEZI|nr:Hypothetical protein R9X50_00711300 [Acrodontium crateriforme]